MSSSWRNSWGVSWGNSWGYVLAAQIGVAQKSIVPISFSNAGRNQIIAGIQDIAVQVLSYMLVAANTVTITFESSTTTVTGAMTMVAGRPLRARAVGRRRRSRVAKTLPRDVCLFRADLGQALNVSISGAVQVSGYMLVERVSRT